MKLEIINIIKDEYKNFNTNLKIGIIIFFIILLIGLFAPFLTQYDPFIKITIHFYFRLVLIICLEQTITEEIFLRELFMQQD